MLAASIAAAHSALAWKMLPGVHLCSDIACQLNDSSQYYILIVSKLDDLAPASFPQASAADPMKSKQHWDSHRTEADMTGSMAPAVSMRSQKCI